MSKELRRAIMLRCWTRRAIEQNDMPEVSRLNEAADKAYVLLDEFEQYVYREWAFDRLALVNGFLIPTPAGLERYGMDWLE